MSWEQQSKVAVRQVTLMLIFALCVCAIIAAFGFWWAGEKQERVPFLNVDILPQEQELLILSSDETLLRPLFWASRRPQEQARTELVEPVQPETVTPLEGVRLLGIIAKGNKHTALLEVDGAVIRASVGSKVKHWVVSRVTALNITFQAGSASEVLTLSRETHQSIKLEL